MRSLPAQIIHILRHFELLFSKWMWEWVKILVVGAILAPGKRTVTALFAGDGTELGAAVSDLSSRAEPCEAVEPQAQPRLLDLLFQAFVKADAPVVLGIDKHLERRRRRKIEAKGIYRDSVCSSRSFFVKSSGLRRVCVMLLAPIPWVKRTWALPFLTVLVPSERYYPERKRAYKPILYWARQMIGQVWRWLPKRQIVVTADSTYLALDFLAACQSLVQPVTLVTLLGLDAALYDADQYARKVKPGAA